MKPVHIDFVPDGRWRLVWAAAALACVAIIGLSTWQWYEISASTRVLDEELKAVQRQLAQLQAQAALPPDPKRANAEIVAKLLRRDLNKMFAVIENLSEPGVRLRSLTLDAPAASLRLEYELDSMARASSVTTLLNAGYEDRPWQLETVTGAPAGSSAQGSGGQQGAVRGVWSGNLDKL